MREIVSLANLRDHHPSEARMRDVTSLNESLSHLVINCCNSNVLKYINMTKLIMKSIHVKLTLPLSLLLFDLGTKWWLVEQVDGPDRYFYGFPFMYKTTSLATSMCTEYILLPMVVDLMIYFLVIYVLVVVLHKKFNLVPHAAMIISAYVVVFLYLFFSVLIVDVVYTPIFTDDGFAITIKETGLYLVGMMH